MYLFKDWFGGHLLWRLTCYVVWINDRPFFKHQRVFLSFQVLKHPDKKFQIGQALKATVIGPDSSNAFLCLSLIGVVMKWLPGQEGRGWKGVRRGLLLLPRLKDALVLESSESLVCLVPSCNYFPGVLLSGLCYSSVV